MNVFSRIHAFEDRIALVDEKDNPVTYARLCALADALLEPYKNRKRLIAIRSANCLSSIAAYVGALRQGHAVILLNRDPGEVEASILETFQPELIYQPDGDVGWHFEAGADAQHDLHPELAVLLSTSGSTGSAKLVKLSKKNIISNAEAIADYLGLSERDRAMTCLPMQYSYGMSVINSHLQVGASLVLNEFSVTDPLFWSRFDRHGATNFQGVPHSFQLLERTSFLEETHPSLRFFTQAGGKLSSDLITRFATYARNCGASFFVMYGQTEASPRISYIPPDQLLANAETIGMAIPGGALRIASGDPRYIDGELVYTGPNIMMGYATSPADLAVDEGLRELATGDIAEQQENGFFRIVGRAKRFVKIFGLRISLDEIEAKLAAEGIVCAATGSDERLYVLTEDAAAEARIMEFLGTGVGLPAHVCSVGIGPIPRSVNGKIDYKAIRMPNVDESSSSLEDEFADLLGKGNFDPSMSFAQMGGDSLTYVNATLVLEKHLGRVPAGWETTPFVQLQAMAEKPAARQTSPVPADVAVRAILISLVLIHHVTQVHLAGSAHALLALAGANFARFQLNAAFSGRLVPLLQNQIFHVLIPYFVVLVPIFLFMGDVFWPQFLLYSNFVPASALGPQRTTIHWFLEAYVTLVVAFSIFSYLARQWAKENRANFALAVFAVATVLRVAGHYNAGSTLFLGNTPLMLAQVFCYGWLLYEQKTLAARLATVVVASALFILLPPSRGYGNLPIFLFSVPLAVYGGSIPAGDVVRKVATAMSAAALYIYIGQTFVIKAFTIPFKGEIPVLLQPLAFVACVLFGIVVSRAVAKIPALWEMRHRQLSTGRIAGGLS